ncbi:MAG: U32 family peptidase [Syntrophomonadaceae bacterium]|nr:U32 family peptidase [Syntrophomonadaceae bacterium]
MELLAPAGNWEAFLAAMKNGADAVYMGGKNYSARQSAENFDLEQIGRAVEYAHVRAKKVYMTVNTLIDNDEFTGALDYLYNLSELQVDAVIVQDIGLAAACRKLLPELRLHASTQMTIHNSDGAALIRDLGFKRIVLARELSVDDIHSICHEVDRMEFEVFVHGAICYCYSGQCLFSSMVGGRSGNRGRCAQPCRMAYQLQSRSGKFDPDPEQAGRYLLSPADLCLIDYLPELRASGVSSLKIEGRMKRPEYVAVVTRAYREALDLMESCGERPLPEVKDKLLKIFNRRFSRGYFIPAPAEFLSTRRPNNRGVFVGRVLEQDYKLQTKIKLSERVQNGDGLVVWVNKGKNPVVLVKDMDINGRQQDVAQPGDVIKILLENRVSPGDRVFKTHDEQILQEAQQSIRDEELGRLPVDAEVYLQLGQPLRLILRDEQGNTAEAFSQASAQQARNQALDGTVLRDKLGRMGNTPFVLRDLTIGGEAALMLPFSEINEVRRQAVEKLIAQRLSALTTPTAGRKVYEQRRRVLIKSIDKNRNYNLPLLNVAVSSLEQAETALHNGADQVLLGLEGLVSGRRPTPKQIMDWMALHPQAADRVIPVLPRIHLSGDAYDYRKITPSGCKKLMVSNWGDLRWGLHQDAEILTDYSLNIFNHYAQQYLQEVGAISMCLSPELNFKQLQSWPDFAKVELLVHGQLQLMESQHCMLCTVLGEEPGHCQAPCRRDRFYLQDEKQYKFPVATDADCRFYVFNSRTLCMLEDLKRLVGLGPLALRIEGRLMDKAELAATVKLYRQALDQLAKGTQPDWEDLARQLPRAEQEFTKGHYYRGVL